jgi:hypothetical protein
MRDDEPGHAAWTGVRWQPFVVLAAFLGAALYHLQSNYITAVSPCRP